MKAIRLSILAVVFVMISGCGVALVKPTSLDQRITYAIGVLAGVRDTAANLVESGRISIEQANYVQSEGDKARAILEDARGFLATGSTADSYDALKTANDILTALSRYLEENKQ